MDYDKKLDNLSGAIIAAQVTLHFNEALKYTSYYKHKLKLTLNAAMKELIKAEEKEFDLIYEIDPERCDTASANVTNIIKTILKYGFSDFVLLGNMITAYHKNPKAISGIVNKVLNK